MKNRRQFLKMTAGTAAASALGTQTSSAQIRTKVRKVWVLSDLHSGLMADGKDGSEWFEEACADIRAEFPDIDFAMTLGDISHGGNEPQLLNYLKVRDASGVHTWYEVAGNHEYHGNSADLYVKHIRPIDPYSMVDGNIAWIFISDEKAGVPGELTPESCDWLEAELKKHKDMNIIVCSHQGVKDTTIQTDKRDRHIHPPERIAEIIEKSNIALWMSGHEHHAPYTPKHIARVGETTYINVASMSHAYGTGGSQSCLMAFVPGSNNIIVRRRTHDTKEFVPEYEVKVPLRHPIRLG
jgi:predicted MPP superfamily phosphohydrolase